MENQSPGRDDRKCQPSLRDFWWPCASIPALKCRAIFKGSSGTMFHRGSRREPALTFPPEENERTHVRCYATGDLNGEAAFVNSLVGDDVRSLKFYGI